MLTFIIAALVVILVLILGGLLAFLVSRFDVAVDKTNHNIDEAGKAYKPGLTLGYEVDTTADPQKQTLEARRLAAKKAAATPRGGNMGISRKGVAATTLVTASKGLKNDPWTAAKIAKFHGWDGAKTGIPAGGAPIAAMPAAAAPAPGGKITLVPGKDYEVIELTDNMSPDEKRKARIANSKAKSAAMKAAKAAGVTAAPVAMAAAGATAVAAPPPVALDIAPPTMIAITDDMSPDETRKARIANSKAKSQFNKALKAAGVDPKTVKISDQGEIIWPSGAPPTSAAPVASAAATAVPAAAPAFATGGVGVFDLAALGIAPPEMTPMSDDMSPDEKRKARINNSKAKSAFNKSLKAAGVDPKTVEIDDSGNVKLKEGAAPVVAMAAPDPTAQPAPPPAAPAPDAGGTVDLAALGIDKPEIVELTDDMAPDDKRQARIANSKAKSAFNKALKAAGIDPKTVKL